MAYVSAALSQAVQARAGERCEYCHFPQALSFLAFEVEHVVAEKHGGATVLDNLARRWLIRGRSCGHRPGGRSTSRCPADCRMPHGGRLNYPMVPGQSRPGPVG